MVVKDSVTDSIGNTIVCAAGRGTAVYYLVREVIRSGKFGLTCRQIESYVIPALDPGLSGGVTTQAGQDAGQNESKRPRSYVS